MKFHNIVEGFILVGFVSLLSGRKSAEAREPSGNTFSSESSYFFYQHSDFPRDCREIHDQCSSSNSSGVHYIRPEGYPEAFETYCEYKVDSGGWTLIQRHQEDGRLIFNRSWDDYKRGFGFLSRDFWIGNERLSFLTNQKRYQLLIEMTTSSGSMITVTYSDFIIGDEFSNYTLMNLSDFIGPANDTISWCPMNMFPGDCTCGKRTCEDPKTCINTCEDGIPAVCVPCPEGFYMKGQDCVPKTECGCYVEEEDMVVPEGEKLINIDCSRSYSCTDGEVTPEIYSCHASAACEDRDNIMGCFCRDGLVKYGETCLSTSDVTNCQVLYDAGIRDNGVYTVNPTDWPNSPFDVYCNMTDGGGWTVSQRRVDGSVDFYLDWVNYTAGFGNLSHEFWLGNDKLHYLTNQGTYQLRIDMVNQNGVPYYAKYTSFRISSSDDKYRLSVLGTYSGTAGYDALAYHRGMAFTTRDNDNDRNSYNCAVAPHSAWWYNNCDNSDLNGDYFTGTDSGIEWYNLPGGHYGLKYTEMKIRPV